MVEEWCGVRSVPLLSLSTEATPPITAVFNSTGVNLLHALLTPVLTGTSDWHKLKSSERRDLS